MHGALKAAVQEAAESAPVVYAHRPVLSQACKVGRDPHRHATNSGRLKAPGVPTSHTITDIMQPGLC